MIQNSTLLAWLREKLAAAEQSVRAREQMAEAFERMGDPKHWEAMLRQPGVIVTYRGRKAPTAKQNKESAAAQRRIAIKCLHEVEMFKATIAAVITANISQGGALELPEDFDAKLQTVKLANYRRTAL